jgi:Ca2+/H+ antiporter, TMEM165/GDT1 family
LLILIVVLGPALARVPLGDLQFVVGVMLILFGLRWLRKAILRASEVIALHDEAAAFASETLRDSGARRTGLDLIAVATANKTVMLEGLEVVFIVIAVGAAMALAMVIALGLIIHRPFVRLPENTLKFAVGILLSAFGTFWTGEGIGAAWPSGDRSILVLIAAFFAVASASVVWCRTQRTKHYSSIL